MSKKYRVYESDVMNGYKITGTKKDPVITIVDDNGHYLKASTVYDNRIAFKESKWDIKLNGVSEPYLHKFIFEFNTLEELENYFVEYLI